MDAAPSYTDTLRTYDGLRLFVQGWQPEGPPRGAVVLVHGYAEHSSRYAHVAGHLTQHGYAIHAYDQRGYGRSEGRRAFVQSFDQYVVDLHDVVRRAREHKSEAPLFILGHSMGGAISALYGIDHGARPAGFILSSPAVEVSQALLLQKAAGFIGWLAPTLPTIRLDHGTLSHDPEVVAWAEADPLNYHGRIPARTGAELLRAARRVQEHAAQLTSPLLIFHGTGDRLIDPEGSRRLYQNAGSSDKTLRLYEDFYHETMNELDKARVLQDVTDWLDAHV